MRLKVLGIICVFCVCILQTKINKATSYNYTYSFLQTHPYQDTSKAFFVENGEFVFRLLEKEISVDFFRKNFRLINKKVVKNKHNSLLKDSILLFSNGLDSARFYVSKSNTILEEMSLNSKKVILDGNIKIGVSDTLFKNKFHINKFQPVIVVKDFENTSFFFFYFKNHLLNKITYAATYLD